MLIAMYITRPEAGYRGGIKNMRIALTGNPNSGKTTMYNALTGRNERIGNWAGVTVEKKESPIKKAF